MGKQKLIWLVTRGTKRLFVDFQLQLSTYQSCALFNWCWIVPCNVRSSMHALQLLITGFDVQLRQLTEDLILQLLNGRLGSRRQHHLLRFRGRHGTWVEFLLAEQTNE